MSKYFVAYTKINTKLTIFYDHYSEFTSLESSYGLFDPKTQRDLAELLCSELNIAMDRGRQEVRDQMQVALGLKLS
jgi:hypothetical protein